MDISQVSLSGPAIPASTTPNIPESKAVQQTSQETDSSTKTASSKDQTVDQFGDPKLRKSVEQFANTILNGTGTEMAFKYNDEIKDWYAVIQDENTGEVVKQIPSKEVIALRASLKEMIGVFLDKKV